MAQVAPSILAADFARLAEVCLPLVNAGSTVLHVDVMDGVFVPNITVGLPVVESLARALRGAVLDVHLMITEPARYVRRFVQAGAGIVTVHCEAGSPVRQTLREIKSCGARAGLSLRPGTPVETMFPLPEEADILLVMSVEPGFGGQAFLPGTPARIAALRRQAARQGLSVQIEVDGGITPATAPLCIAAGADILVAGSAVFGAEDPAAAVRLLLGG